MRSKSLILLVLALGCGLVASIGISQVMEARNKAPDPGERQAIFVALTDINAKDELTAQNIKLEEWPTKIVPPGALTKLEEIEGKRCRTKLYSGEPVLASKILGADENLGAAKDIPTGYRVAHVKVDPITGSSNLIVPGDRVDVLVFKQPGNDLNATAAKIVLQDIKVFAVDLHTVNEYTNGKGDHAEPVAVKTIALLVTPEESVILHAASEISGSVRLVLRNPDDDAHVNDQGTSITEIFGSNHQSNRNAEDSDAKKAITDWLNQQKEKIAPVPPPAPKIVAPPRRMTVMLGAELQQLDIPSNGEPPNDSLHKKSPSSSNITPSQLTRSTNDPPVNKPNTTPPPNQPKDVTPGK